MSKINDICTNIATIIENKDLQHYKDEGFENFIQAVFTGDAFSGISALSNVKEYIFHIPTALFWDKMKRFLLGTYHNFEEQIRMASKFNSDDQHKFVSLIKSQINVINQIEDDKKIDYYSQLTRCVLLDLIDLSQYNRLTKSILSCTSDELQYVIDEHDKVINYNMTVYFLHNEGIVEQVDTTQPELFKLSEYGNRLYTYALSSDEVPKKKIKNDELSAPSDHLIGRTSKEDIESLFKDDTIVINSTI